MNQKFNKALYLLDMGKYKAGEKNLRMAIKECENPFELAEIKSCYAQLLYETGRYEEAMKYVNDVLENTSEYDDNNAREIAMDIKTNIEIGLKFDEALRLIDTEKYEEAEESLRMAMEKCENPIPLAEMKSWYAVCLYETGQYEEAMKYVNDVLENTSDEGEDDEEKYAREIAIGLKETIEEEKNK